MRLSRRVLATLGGVSAIAVAGALSFALWPQGVKAPTQELYSTGNRQPPDGLSGLPSDYSGLPKPVPQLGPPLPGDLGKPILNAGAPTPGMPAATQPDPEAQRLAQQRQRLVQEIEAARTSRLFASEAGARHATGRRRRLRAAGRNGAAARPGRARSQCRRCFPANGERPQTRLPERSRRPPRNQRRCRSSSCGQQRSSSRRGHPGRAVDRPALRPPRPDHRAGDRGRLRQPDRQDPAHPARCAADRPVRRPGDIWSEPGAACMEQDHHAERPVSRSGTPARRRRRGLCRSTGPGRQSLGGTIQGGAPLDHPVGRFGGRNVERRERSRRRDPARRLGLDQPDRSASGRAFAAGSADDHRAARVPGPRDRDARPCDGALRRADGGSMSKLKLGPITDDKPIRVTHDLPPAVHRDLVAYAEALARETGAVVEPVKLIAPMLERFMATDRAFSKARRTLPAAPATATGVSPGAPRPAGAPNSESA